MYCENELRAKHERGASGVDGVELPVDEANRSVGLEKTLRANGLAFCETPETTAGLPNSIFSAVLQEAANSKKLSALIIETSFGRPIPASIFTTGIDFLVSPDPKQSRSEVCVHNRVVSPKTSLNRERVANTVLHLRRGVHDTAQIKKL